MSLRSLTGRFFGFIGRVLDALRVFIGRLFFLLFLIVLLLLVFSGPAGMQVPKDGLVILDPKGAIVEQPGLLDPQSLLLGSAEVTATPLRDVLDALERAATDSRIRGVVLDLTELTAVSPSVLETIGAALERYRESGKSLIAHGDYYSQAQYFLASWADTVYLHPMGQLMLPGYGGSQLYFASLLEKLGINVHIFRVGTHKAAVEPFSLDGMSDLSRANMQQLVDELWARYLNQVAANRGITPEALRSYANDYPAHLLAVGGDTARVALEHGLVDELVSQPEFRARLSALAGASGGNPRTIGFQDFLLATHAPTLPAESEIGVIVAEGTIDMGEQPRGAIGADSLVALIRDARRDERIKAVVLRVDSPGGSALASELIRQELEQLQEAGKPLVVSMGGTAASGGYWISAMADEIWASPATVTGSIGIFGLVPTVEEGLGKLGVRADGVSTTPLTRADPLTGMSEAMATVLQASVEDGYRRFLQLVSDGRNLSIEQVDAVAQGQIWSGSQALAFGLVDNLGELDDAITAAARLAVLDDYAWRYIEKPLSPGEQFTQELIRNFGMSTLGEAHWLQGLMRSGVQQTLESVSTLARFNDPRDLYSVCEFCGFLGQDSR
jgi:protease-4